MTNSFFQNIFASRNINAHDGKPLWKYDLTDKEFYQLKSHLVQTRSLYNIDPRDCALYFAEWWKRCYNGGSPSKLDVFLSISSNHLFNEEEFYDAAKKGAHILGIKWIKAQNTLYFRTLLLQGGLPKNHILKNQKAYASFLLKIWQLNPSTVDDFALNPEITKLLPASSRNPVIYENCLEIIKGESELLSMLDSSHELKQVADKIRSGANPNPISRSKIKAHWMLAQKKDGYNIFLHLSISENISTDVFANTFFSSNQNAILFNEYQLFVNEDLSCKFIKKLDGNYKTIWFNNHNLNWNGDASFPEIYLKDMQGTKTEITNLIGNYPKLSVPTLWTEYSEKEWVLEKGKNSNNENAFVLFPKNYVIDEPSNSQNLHQINLCNSEMNWVMFSKEIKFKNNIGETAKFNTNKVKFDWHILNTKPEWFFKTNMPVVTNRPKIIVFNEQGERINAEIKWRKDKYQQWQDFTYTLPVGHLEIKINADEVEETDELFNVGNLELKFNSNQLMVADIEASNNDFNININQENEYAVEYLSDTKIRLKLANDTHLPKTIHGSLSVTNQRKKLHFELIPPFKGVEILDASGNVIPSNYQIQLGKLHGYGIMSNEKNLVINLYNNSRPNIIISQPLNNNYSPLIELNEPIQKLIRLTDIMNENSFITIEIAHEINGNQKKLKSYQIHNYTGKFIKEYDEHNNLYLTTNSNVNTDVYAAPAECTNEEIELFCLNNNEGRYSFTNEMKQDKFIVFTDSERHAYVRPGSVSNNSIIEVDSSLSIEAIKQKLLNENCNAGCWKALLKYFSICVNNNLPFSSFTTLKGISSSSALAAKAFVFFVYSDEKEKFVIEYSKELEDDLGFSFHWIAKDDWWKALEWIGAFDNENLHSVIIDNVNAYFKNLYPNENFNKIYKYILSGNIEKIASINTPDNIYQLRASLGARVLKELPTICPKIPVEFKNVLPVNDTNSIVKILIKSPLAVALSISGNDSSIWNSEADTIRRNIQYCQEIKAEWYSKAICYCLSKL